MQYMPKNTLKSAYVFSPGIRCGSWSVSVCVLKKRNSFVFQPRYSKGRNTNLHGTLFIMERIRSHATALLHRRILRLSHKRHAILRTLLLRRRARQSRRLGASSQALLLPAILAAHKRQEADAEHNGRGKDNGDNDAARVELVNHLHAHGAAAAVDGAGKVGLASGRGGLGVYAGEGGDCAVVGLHGAKGCLDHVKVEAGVALEVFAAQQLRGGCGSWAAAVEDGAVADAEVA